ncbi:MAG: tRNA (guanine-N1)-methyltransferase [uncultured bacterium (gcode 4)]|uniref:tRNA (guanine-N(1)-)-methyltransferase n=1 Tax=uncultured bacterium (gcode 4) TaxID=1234023 RepID=K1YIZ9_9BACT|nr:MAG: tRNA (guanine-N1)-methyltransferase [uncultured bacterium (gcode 4)]
MHIHIVSIFPDIFKSFTETSLIKKAQEKKILSFTFINPRIFCPGRHQQVDDTIYGGGAGLLMKAQPAIEAVESIIQANVPLDKGGKPKGGFGKKFKIILLSPSKEVFTQKLAHTLSEEKNLIFVCTRYEGIDYRFEQYMKKKYPKQFQKISIGQYITLGGEIPAMVMIESISRLIPGVIKEEASRQEESYSVKQEMNNLEYPQYTKPEVVLGMKIPKILISGHHANIKARREKKTKTIKRKKKQ